MLWSETGWSGLGVGGLDWGVGLLVTATVGTHPTGMHSCNKCYDTGIFTIINVIFI